MRKTIKFAVSMRGEEFEAMEAIRKKIGLTRSAFIRAAFQTWREARREESSRRSDVEGYRQIPEDASLGRRTRPGVRPGFSRGGFEVRRGEIWWAELGPPAGRWPVLLLSRNDAYAVRTAVTIAPLTTTIRKIPVEVALDVKDGLPKPCVVNLDLIATIPKRCLISRLAALPDKKMSLVEAAIRFALDLRPLVTEISARETRPN